ncbi:hypothetical protein V8E36_000856 [Tilletia maclaganii]
MDIYTRFDLPPPPPPTIFSRESGPSRARLPNFTSVDEVSNFISDAIVWRHPPSVDHFLFFSAACLLLLEFILVIFIVHHIHKKSWWVFRLVRRNHRVWLVPNAHSLWALWFGLFALMMIGACFPVIRLIDPRSVPPSSPYSVLRPPVRGFGVGSLDGHEEVFSGVVPSSDLECILASPLYSKGSSTNGRTLL